MNLSWTALFLVIAIGSWQSKAESFDSEVVLNKEDPNFSEVKSLSQLIKRDSGTCFVPSSNKKWRDWKCHKGLVYGCITAKFDLFNKHRCWKQCYEGQAGWCYTSIRIGKEDKRHTCKGQKGKKAMGDWCSKGKDLKCSGKCWKSWLGRI